MQVWQWYQICCSSALPTCSVGQSMTKYDSCHWSVTPVSMALVITLVVIFYYDRNVLWLQRDSMTQGVNMTQVAWPKMALRPIIWPRETLWPRVILWPRMALWPTMTIWPRWHDLRRHYDLQYDPGEYCDPGWHYDLEWHPELGHTLVLWPPSGTMATAGPLTWGSPGIPSQRHLTFVYSWRTWDDRRARSIWVCDRARSDRKLYSLGKLTQKNDAKSASVTPPLRVPGSFSHSSTSEALLTDHRKLPFTIILWYTRCTRTCPFACWPSRLSSKMNLSIWL